MPNQQIETLGPAERIINTLTQYVDHAVHHRPGVAIHNPTAPGGAVWQQATWVAEADEKVVYKVSKHKGKKQQKTKIGVLVESTNEVLGGNGAVARWQPPGLFPEVVGYLYQRIADVWTLDNEFAAKWASWAFDNETSRDLKVILAAFMLVQNRTGAAVPNDDGIALRDVDYRAVGEAMCLTRKQAKLFDPKMLLRVGEVLELPQVAEINRKLGFGISTRNALRGRYDKMIHKWLNNLEHNTKLLNTLVTRHGFRKTILRLAQKTGYKPTTENFFGILRWKQKQSPLGHRTLAIGKSVRTADTFENMNEAEICQYITKNKPNWKVIAGKLPQSIGVTRAILTAAVQAGSLSDADLIIMTPTLEELDLLRVPEVSRKWQRATEKAKDQRAANIAKNVKTSGAKEGLESAADAAAARAVEEVAKDFRVYVVVDKSGSMEKAMDKAKEYLTKFVGAFPLDRLHVSVFNTWASELQIRGQSRAHVELAFRGHSAGGGTSYASGVACLLNNHKPKENEDVLFIFVGDQADPGLDTFVRTIRAYGVIPAAFGLLHIDSQHARYYNYNIVEKAAATLGIPCFRIDEKIFDDEPYAIPRTLRNIIAATPVTRNVDQRQSAKSRKSLIEMILATPLLQKPIWA